MRHADFSAYKHHARKARGGKDVLDNPVSLWQADHIS
jgi:hypothetical protein